MVEPGGIGIGADRAFIKMRTSQDSAKVHLDATSRCFIDQRMPDVKLLSKGVSQRDSEFLSFSCANWSSWIKSGDKGFQTAKGCRVHDRCAGLPN